MRGRPWTKREIEKLVDLTLDGVGRKDVARRLHRASDTVRKMQIELELIKASELRRRWTLAEIELVKQLYPHVLTATLAKRLGKPLSTTYQMAARLGVKKSPEFLSSAEACILRRDPSVGLAGRFKPGLVPHNKGKRSPGSSTGRMAETQFKKGARPWDWKPLGSTRVMDGYEQTKVADTGYTPRDWQPTHVLLWREMRGPVPEGHAVCFLDGDKKHIAIGNLELVSRAEIMARNTIHNLPAELKDTIMLLGRVKRKVRENAEKHDDRPAKPLV
jgi:HNH endonuclease